MVPNLKSVDAGRGNDCLCFGVEQDPGGLELVHVPDERIMISRRGILPAFFTAMAALRMARVWNLDEVRDHQAEAAAAKAEHRFCSCID